MEDIEYLEEFKDMVRTSIEPTTSRNANDAKARENTRTLSSIDKYSDSSSSAIDMDIFEKLFNNDSDGDIPKTSGRKKQKKKTINVRLGPTSFSSSDYDSDDSDYNWQTERSKALKGRSTVRDSIDFIDDLVNDIGDSIPDRVRKSQPTSRPNKVASVASKSIGGNSTTTASSSKPKPGNTASDTIRGRPSINNAKKTNLQPATSTSTPKTSVYKSAAPQNSMLIEKKSTLASTSKTTQSISFNQKPTMVSKTQIVPQKLLMTHKQLPTQKPTTFLQKSTISQNVSSSSKPTAAKTATTQKPKLLQQAKQTQSNQVLGNGKYKTVQLQKTSNSSVATASSSKFATQPRANINITVRRTFVEAKDSITHKQIDPRKDPLNLDENDFGDGANDSDVDNYLSLPDDDDDDELSVNSESFDSSDFTHESDDEHVIDISTDSNFSGAPSELRSTPPPNVSDSDETATADKITERMQSFLEDLRVNSKRKTLKENESDCSLDSLERSLEAKHINSSKDDASFVKCDLTNDTIHKTLLDKESNENFNKILTHQASDDKPSSAAVVIVEECVAVETHKKQVTSTEVDKDNQTAESNTQTEIDSVKSPTTTIKEEENKPIDVNKSPPKPTAESTPLLIGASCSSKPTTNTPPTANKTDMTEVLELPGKRRLYEENKDTPDNVQNQQNSNVMDDFDESITLEQIEQSSLELQKKIMEMDSDLELSLDFNRRQSTNSRRNSKSTNFNNMTASSTTNIHVTKPDTVKRPRGRPKKQRAQTTDEPKTVTVKKIVKMRAFSDSALAIKDHYVESNPLPLLKSENSAVTKMESNINELKPESKTETKVDLKVVEQEECVRKEKNTTMGKDVEGLLEVEIGQESPICDDPSTAEDGKKDVEMLIETITILESSKEEIPKSIEQTTEKNGDNVEKVTVSPTKCEKVEGINENISLPSKSLNHEECVSKSEKDNSNKSIPESDNKSLKKDEIDNELNKLNDVKEHIFELPPNVKSVEHSTDDINQKHALDSGQSSSRDSKRSDSQSSRSSKKHKDKKHKRSSKERDRSHDKQKSSDKKHHSRESSKSSSKAENGTDKEKSKSHKKHDEKKRHKHDSSHRKEKHHSSKSHKTEQDTNISDKNKQNGDDIKLVDDDIKLIGEKESKKEKETSKDIDGKKDEVNHRKHKRTHSKKKNKESETKPVKEEKMETNDKPKVEQLKVAKESTSSQDVNLNEKAICVGNDGVDSQIVDKPDKKSPATQQEDKEETPKKISKNSSEKEESLVADQSTKGDVIEQSPMRRSKRSEHDPKEREETQQTIKSTLQKDSNPNDKALVEESNGNSKSDLFLEMKKQPTEIQNVENCMPKVLVANATQQEEVSKSLNTIKNSEVASDSQRLVDKSLGERVEDVDLKKDLDKKVSEKATEKCGHEKILTDNTKEERSPATPTKLTCKTAKHRTEELSVVAESKDLTTKSVQKKDLIERTKDATKTKQTSSAAKHLFVEQQTEMADENKPKETVREEKKDDDEEKDLQASISTRSTLKSSTEKSVPTKTVAKSARKKDLELESKDSNNAKDIVNSPSKLTRCAAKNLTDGSSKALADSDAKEFQPKEEIGDSIKDTVRPATLLSNASSKEIVSKEVAAEIVNKNMLPGSSKPRESAAKKLTRSAVKNFGDNLKVDTEESDSSGECNRKKLGTEAIRNSPITRSSARSRTESIRTDTEESDSKENAKQILKKSSRTEKSKSSDIMRMTLTRNASRNLVDNLTTAEKTDSKKSVKKSKRKKCFGKNRDEKGQFIQSEAKRELLKRTKTDTEEKNHDCVDSLKHTPKRKRKTATDLEHKPKILCTNKQEQELVGAEIKDNETATDSVICATSALEVVDVETRNKNALEMPTSVSSATISSTTQEIADPEAEITKNSPTCNNLQSNASSKQEIESLPTSKIEVNVSTSTHATFDANSKNIEDATSSLSEDKVVSENIGSTLATELDVIDQVGDKEITQASIEQNNKAAASIDKQFDCADIVNETEVHTPYEHLPVQRTPIEDLLPVYDVGILACDDDMVIEQFIEVEFSQMDNLTNECHAPQLGGDCVDDPVTRELVDILSAEDENVDSEVQRNDEALVVEMTDEEFLSGLIDFALPKGGRTTNDKINIVGDNSALDALLNLEQAEITEKVPITTDEQLYNDLVGDQAEDSVIESGSQEVDNGEKKAHERDVNVVVNQVCIEETKTSSLAEVDGIFNVDAVIPTIVKEPEEAVENESKSDSQVDSTLKAAEDQAETTETVTPEMVESTAINKDDKINENNTEKNTTEQMENVEKSQVDTISIESTIKNVENSQADTTSIETRSEKSMSALSPANNVHDEKSPINQIGTKKLRVNLKRIETNKLAEIVESDVTSTEAAAMSSDVDTKQKAEDDDSTLIISKRSLRKRGVDNATTTSPRTPSEQNAAIRRRELERALLISKHSKPATGKSVDQKLVLGKTSHFDRFQQPSDESQPSKKVKLSMGTTQSPLKGSPGAITINTKASPDLKTKNALLKTKTSLSKSGTSRVIQGRKVVAKPAETVTTISKEASEIDAKTDEASKVFRVTILSNEGQISRTVLDTITEASKTQAVNKEKAATKNSNTSPSVSKERQAVKLIASPTVAKRAEALTVAESSSTPKRQSLPKHATNTAMLKLFSNTSREASKSPAEEEASEKVSVADKDKDKSTSVAKTVLEPVNIAIDKAKVMKKKQNASSDIVSSTTVTAKETATKPTTATNTTPASASAKLDEIADNAKVSGASTAQAQDLQQPIDGNQKTTKETETSKERGRKKKEKPKVIKKPSTCGEAAKETNILSDHENSSVSRETSNERTPRRAVKAAGGGGMKFTTPETSHDRAMSSNEAEGDSGGKRETSKERTTRKSLRAASMTPTAALLGIRKATYERNITAKPEDDKNELPSEAELIESAETDAIGNTGSVDKQKTSAVDLQSKSGKRKAAGTPKVATKRSRLNAIGGEVCATTALAIKQQAEPVMSIEASTEEKPASQIQTFINDKNWKPRLLLNRRAIDNYYNRKQSASNDPILVGSDHTTSSRSGLDVEQLEGYVADQAYQHLSTTKNSNGATPNTSSICSSSDQITVGEVACVPFTFLEPKSEVDEVTDKTNETPAIVSSLVNPTVQTNTRTLLQAAFGGTAAADDAASTAIQSTELVPRSASNSTLQPNEVDAAANVIGRTSLYSYLYPAKYDRSYGNVQLDYCCPNLNGPMRAIDPTRLHQEQKAPVREVPSCIVMTTKVVKASEYKKNRDILPEPVRLKLERRNGGISLASVLAAGGGAVRSQIPRIITPATSAQSLPTTGNAQNLTTSTSASGIATITCQATASSVPQPTTTKSSLNEKSKKLPKVITTSKVRCDVPAATSSATPLAALSAVAPVGSNQMIATQSVQRPMALLNVDLLSLTGLQTDQRQQMLRSVQLFDELLQSLARRVLTLSVHDRQRTIAAIVGNSHLEAIDFEVGMKLLKNYETWISEVTATTVQTQSVQQVSAAKPSKATRANITISKVVPPPMGNQKVKTTTAKSTVISRKPSGSTNVAGGASAAPVAKRPCQAVPILGTNNTVVGYQFRTNVEKNATVATTTTAAETITSEAASTIPTTITTTNTEAIKSVSVPSTGYRTRRGGLKKPTPAITPTSLHVTTHLAPGKQTPAASANAKGKTKSTRPRGRPRGWRKNPAASGSVEPKTSSAASIRSNLPAKSSRSVARKVQASPISITTVNTCGSPDAEECILPDAMDTTPLDPSLIKTEEDDEDMII